ncbi:fibronectin type III domain-containing protein [Kribbella catacumbae]|uniref:rhamnogalacturonan lyase family protein n=1 Tax=Kribbella catacumbae TaxID=460086 RepID=UPI00192CD8AE|nr:fibronectin type III domain-containing protein [Kribbella catacumbae]
MTSHPPRSKAGRFGNRALAALLPLALAVPLIQPTAAAAATAEVAYRFDFGPSSSAVADGYTAVGPVAYEAGRGYGFADPAKVTAVDRGTDDAVRTDFVAVAGTSFVVDLPNGDYTVALVAGDATESSEIAITGEKMAKVQLTPKPAAEYLAMTFPVSLVDGQLNLDFSGSAAKLNSLVITRLPARTAGPKPTAFLAGDSTVQTYDPGFAPQAGWGQMLGRFLSDDVLVVNKAIGGRSSKNFISQGRLDEILRAIRPADYLFIQFGHNDATQGVDDRYASPADYKEYLRTYVHGTRQRGAVPVLVTPVSRRSFDPATGKFNVSFPEYVAKMVELAAEEEVDLVDLSASSRAYLDQIGPDTAKAVFLHVDPGVYPGRPNGTVDDTHFQEYGAIQLARLVATDVAKLDVPLADEVVEVEPPANVPAAPTGLLASSVSNAGAVLRWTAPAGADIYRIYRKTASAPDTAYALVGTTTSTSAVVQGLAEGESYSYRVGAVNGRGESEPSVATTFTTKRAKYKFDFQPVGAQVAAGYTEVNRTMTYSVERGFGFTQAPEAMADRDRGSTAGVPNDLQRDFVLSGSPFEFKLDVPNGTYMVKTYSGDWIGSSRTDFAIEGKPAGSGNAGKESVTEKLKGPVSVADGQLNIVISGTGARLNGIDVTPLLVAPANLKVDSIAPQAHTATLSWDAEADAVGYRVYRQGPGDDRPVNVADQAALGFVDSTVTAGLDYAYYVTAIDNTGLESVPSAVVRASIVDPAVAVPDAPTRLKLLAIHKHDLTLDWKKSKTAWSYLIARAESPDGPYKVVGRTTATSFKDRMVLTTIKYYYQVSAVNVGGVSAASVALETPAVTVLKRQAEYLDRAPSAVPTADGKVLVGWRLLGTDPESIAFHLYRDGVRITPKPLVNATSLLDPAGTATSRYRVAAVSNGKESPATAEFGTWAKGYFSLRLDKPADDYTKDGQPYTYSAGDASAGDVDGDGSYEIIQLWTPSNSKDNSQAGYTGLVYLDAYKLDGTRLWRINLGPNIRAGAHYTQFQVYDLDGDGRAEVTLRTADGTTDGSGTVIGDPNADYRNSSGYVLTGPEFLSVIEGSTGKVLDTVDYTPPRGDVGSWGDTYGNRVDRFLAGVAYLDGEHPSVVFSRGYYTRAVLAAYDLVGGELQQRWVFDSGDKGSEGGYGMGNHNLSVADVDADGKDEIVFGSMTVDDNGKLLYSTGLGHGDALHVSDLIPARPGLEVFAAHEDMGRSGNRGATMRDARTGSIIWDIPATRDTGRAAAGDIDPRHPGAEGWAVGGDAAWNSRVGQLKSSTGELVSTTIPAANFLAWWDGDPLREIVDHDWNTTTLAGTPTIARWNWEASTTDVLLTDPDARSNNGTKGTPVIQADLFGDWREEIAWRSTDSSELRIYSTPHPTDRRMHTLMHDPVYRLGVAWQNTAYNQPPHPGFFIGQDMVQPKPPSIVVRSPQR